MLSLFDKRLFTQEQKAYLFDRADGKCEVCGVQLGDDWQADHIDRYTDGGATSLSNAQALCPHCHTEKTRHENVLDHAFRPVADGRVPRDWQKDALRTIEKVRLDSPEQTHYAVSATPGSGKSMFMELVARHYLHLGLIDTVLCVVPSDTLRLDASRNFKDDIGVELVSSAGPLKVRDVKGAIGQVCTYQQLSNAENLDTVVDYWTREGKRLLVIADEIHHAADHAASSWGESLSYALERSTFALLLSGTLWRTDETKIPGIQYIDIGDQELLAQPHYSLGLKQATEQGYVTTVWFDRMDIQASFVPRENDRKEFDSTSDVITTCLRDTDGKAADILHRMIVEEPELEGVKKLLAEGHKSLMQLKKRHLEKFNAHDDDSVPPTPAGLVVAPTKKVADSIARVLTEITGRKPVIVHGSVPTNCKERIKRFRRSDKDWIVSVGMVSEGVDIPRIKVICYLTNKKTKLVFSQIVGRAQRVRYDNDGDVIEEQAKVLVPAHPTLDAFAEDFLECQGAYAKDDDLFATNPDDLRDTESRALEDLIEDARNAEKEVEEQVRRNVMATYHVSTDTIVDGQQVNSDMFFQLMADHNISMDTAKAIHVRATHLGMLTT